MQSETKYISLEGVRENAKVLTLKFRVEAEKVKHSFRPKMIFLSE